MAIIDNAAEEGTAGTDLQFVLPEPPGRLPRSSHWSSQMLAPSLVVAITRLLLSRFLPGRRPRADLPLRRTVAR
jgi:hypothetical protein